MSYHHHDHLENEKKYIEDERIEMARARVVPLDSELDVDPVFEKKTMRKIDLRLIPILAVMYSFALIDRGNLGLVYVAGMGKDLKLQVSNHYSIAILLFFPPYIVLEMPANLVIRRVGAARWLSGICLAWGGIMTGMAFINDWTQLAALRFALGVLEAGFFPACAYLISTWYTRSEMQIRLATFYLVSTLVGGFSAFIAFGFSKIKGSLKGWRYIFLIEGVMTMATALVAYFLIVDFPDQNTFLTKEQTAFVKRRIDADRGDAEYDPMTARKVFKHLSDFKIWIFGVMFCGSTTPAYAFASFLPIIIGGMGYNDTQAQLLTAPPAVAAVVVAMTLSWACDRVGKRAPFLLLQSLMCFGGLAMTAYCKSNAARYAGTFLGLSGCNANIPTILAYQSTNIVGQSKRSVSNAIVVAFGGVGGIISALIMRSQDAPRYLPGIWGNMGFQFIIVALTLIMTLYFNSANKSAKAGRRTPIENRIGFYYTI